MDDDIKWIECKGYPNYQISNTGLIKSIDRIVNASRGTQFKRGKLLSPSITNWGYYTIKLHTPTTMKHVSLHVLIATAFIENPSNYSVVNHKDGNKLNNAVSNLEWCTHLENCNHSIQTGLSKVGEDHPNAKLSNSDVVAIRNEFALNKPTHKFLADKYNTSRQNITTIINNKSRTLQ